MTLIDKDALVAEIERRIKSLHQVNSPREQAVLYECKDILSFLDTLSVKDVDLEKEMDKFYGIYRKNGRTYLVEDNGECVDWKVDCNPKFEIAFARHFFELGLKTQKGE